MPAHVQEWSCVSQAAKELLPKLLEPDPALRITAAACLGEPWLNPSTSRRQLTQQASLESPAVLRQLQSLHVDSSVYGNSWLGSVLSRGGSPGGLCITLNWDTLPPSSG